MKKSFLIPWAGLVLFVGACSSSGKKQDELPDLATGSATTAAPSEVPEGAENLGLITFFESDDKGLVIKNIRWNKPLSSENPGADCELRSQGRSTFACSIELNQESVNLTMLETNTAGMKRLSRIVLMGSGAATRDRWVQQLESSGYTQLKKSTTRKAMFLSKDRKTLVMLFFSPSRGNVRVVFSAAH